MSDSIAPHQVPGIPPPPPQLNRKKLWISLLLPPGVMVVLMIILVVVASTGTGTASENVFTFVCIGACFASLIGWILFIQTMSERFRGGSLVLLIIAYPIVQFILLFSIFFVGCFAAIWSEGYY